MNKIVFASIVCCSPFLTHIVCGEEAAAPVKTETPKVSLADAFSTMTPAEIIDTGIGKLSLAEQNALISWWNRAKLSSHDHHSITKEVTISSISDEGKHVVLSDGSRLSLDSSTRKKIGRWAVGDTLGLGESGKRGSITVYHMTSGQKVKAKREQAPQQSPEK